MAYDETLAERIRDVLIDVSRVEEKKMFGGLCFMVTGHMACGIVGDDLMLRVGKEGYEDALAQPGAREMDFTGRALKGMVYVGPEGCETDADLDAWVARSLAFVRTLPRR